MAYNGSKRQKKDIESKEARGYKKPSQATRYACPQNPDREPAAEYAEGGKGESGPRGRGKQSKGGASQSKEHVTKMAPKSKRFTSNTMF